MNLPQSTEQLRTGALQLLASGNSIESVAHVLGIPIDLVASWQTGTTATPSVATIVAQTRPFSGPERPRVRSSQLQFDLTLDYSTSAAYRKTMACCAIGVLVVAVWLFSKMLHQPLISRADIGLMLLMAIGTVFGVMPLLRLARISLVLDENGIVVPGLLRNTRMPYSDLARYSIEPGGVVLGRNSTLKGETLRIYSRRPGVEPIEVFIAENYPLDGDIASRLDEVCRANRARFIPSPT